MPDRNQANYGYDATYDMLPPKLSRILRGAVMAKDFVKEHPAETAVGVLSAPLLEVSVPSALIAGSLAGGSRVIDKTHPLTNEQSDFETMTPIDNTLDIAGNAVGGSVLHYGGGRLAKYLGGAEALPVRGAGLARQGLVLPTPTEMPTMATGIRYPRAMADATMTPLERNQAVIRELASIPPEPPAPPVREIKDAFRDYVPLIDKNVSLYFPKAPAGTAFKMPLGSFNASASTGVSPARLIDKAFLR